MNIFFLATLFFATSAYAAAAPVTITGAVQKPLTLTLAQLQAMPAVDVTVAEKTDHAMLSGRFHGPLLWALIGQAGWANGNEKNGQFRHIVLVTGKDGYVATLSEGEIDPTLEGKQVILAYEKDGAPLAAPRLIVPGDMYAPREVHDVVSIAVQ